MNALDKLAKEKFNGDIRATWQYIFDNATDEERRKYINTASMDQLNIALTAIRRENLNEIDDLANSKFDGDLRATWDYIFSACSPEEVERYVDMADKHQASIAMVSIEEGNHKYAKEARAQAKIDEKLLSLNLSREEVINIPQNPYRGKLLKSLLKITLTTATVIVLSVFGPIWGLGADAYSVAVGILGTASTYFAFEVADNLLKYFKFRSVKKALEKDLEEMSRENA